MAKKHLQSILGYINHLAKVVRAARVFVSRLLAALRAATGDVIQVTTPVKADLAWFSRYLDNENARCIIPHNRTVQRLWADSSLLGAGATDGARYYKHRYNTRTATQHPITQLEAINVLAAVRTFVDASHAAWTIEVSCDNSSSIASYTSGRARDVVLAACYRALWFHAAATQNHLVFAHMPREGMVLPDALSRASHDPRYEAKAQSIIRAGGPRAVPISHAMFAYMSFL